MGPGNSKISGSPLFAVQRLSDLICLEHQLSTIEYKPYRERQKRIVYPSKESNRDRLCSVIDSILAEKPKDYEDFLQRLEQQGYEVKRGKHTAVKGKGQKRFIRFRTLGTGYGEDEIKAVLEGKAKHHPYPEAAAQRTALSSCWWTFRGKKKWQRAKALATKSGQRSST